MLELLKVKNYALIDHLEINFNKGFTIITGETGAGKSILFGALGILLGQRVDFSVISDKTKKCIVEAQFFMQNHNLSKFFENNDLDYFDDTIIRREISPKGRTRAFINDTPVTLSVIKEIGNILIDIHSQHDTLMLNNPDFQLDVIDTFAHNSKILDDYKTGFKEYLKFKKELKDLEEKAQKEKSDYDYYLFQFNHIDEAKLIENEQEDLESKQKIFSHSEEIKSNLLKISNNLSENESSILALLKQSVAVAEETSPIFEKATEIYERLNSVYIELQDLSGEVEISAEDIEHNPENLEFVNQRLDTIYGLQQKYNIFTITELLNLKNELENNLEKISNFDNQISEKKILLQTQKEELGKIAEKLSKNRTKIFGKIEKEVANLLGELGMPKSSFIVNNERLTKFSKTGIDNIKFLFSANPKMEANEISKVASGGELSRLMLSLKYLVSQSKTLPTIIFDEIDTGVSGEIASKVGRIMKKMSANLQVIDITHLPQVAAQADFHYLIYKKENENSTNSNIRQLSEEERVTEIAKMLSGKDITAAAIENAKQLIG